MTLTGTIWDNTTGDGIPGATVQVVDAAGNLGTGTAADANGFFSLSSDILDLAGSQVRISSVGFQAVLIAPALLVEQGGIGLDQSNANLPAATVTAHMKPKINPLWVGIALALLGVLLYIGTRKAKAGKIDLPKIDWLKIALYIGIPVAAYFLIVRPILVKLGILADKSNSPQAQANQAALDKSIANTQQSGGTQSKTTYTATQYQGWANDIYAQGISSDVDQSAIVNDVINSNTLMDLLQIKQAFGTRKASNAFWSTCNWLNFNCPEYDLDAFIKAVLDSDHLNQINTYLSETGINYTFA